MVGSKPKISASHIFQHRKVQQEKKDLWLEKTLVDWKLRIVTIVQVYHIETLASSKTKHSSLISSYLVTNMQKLIANKYVT